MEKLPRGSIMNAHHMMTNRPFRVNARCSVSTHIYTLHFDHLTQTAYNYKKLARSIIREKGKAETARLRETHPLDYISGSFYFKDPKEMHYDLDLSKRMQHAMFVLKDSVVFHLFKNRRNSKIHCLKQVISNYIKKKTKQKEIYRELKRELADLSLEDRLTQITSKEKMLSKH